MRRGEDPRRFLCGNICHLRASIEWPRAACGPNPLPLRPKYLEMELGQPLAQSGGANVARCQESDEGTTSSVPECPTECSGRCDAAERGYKGQNNTRAAEGTNRLRRSSTRSTLVGARMETTQSRERCS